MLLVHPFPLHINVNIFLCLSETKKKLDRRGKDRPHGIALRRNLSQTGRENPRTLASPYRATP
jgi:hypothetical protein